MVATGGAGRQGRRDTVLGAVEGVNARLGVVREDLRKREGCRATSKEMLGGCGVTGGKSKRTPLCVLFVEGSGGRTVIASY